MLLQISLNITGAGLFVAAFLLAALVLIGAKLYQSGTLTSLRKFAPYLLFVALGVLFVGGKPLVYWLTNLAYGVDSGAVRVGNDINATGAAIEADQTAGGWVQLGTATSKLVMSATFYVFFSIITWALQQITHPGPTKWAKEQYTTEFNELRYPMNKFEVYQRMRLTNTILAAAAILGACLIQ